MKMGQPLSTLVAELLDKGSAVMAIDCFGTGELKTDERKRTANHWLTYNRTDLALRVQDILTAVGYLQSREDIRQVALVGQDAVRGRVQAHHVGRQEAQAEQPARVGPQVHDGPVRRDRDEVAERRRAGGGTHSGEERDHEQQPAGS